MDEDRLYSGMNEEQIAAYERAERQKAADDMPIEELFAAIRQTAYQIHLYLGTGYLEKVYENALVHRLEKLGIEARPANQLRLAQVRDQEEDLFEEEPTGLELRDAKTFTDRVVTETKVGPIRPQTEFVLFRRKTTESR